MDSRHFVITLPQGFKVHLRTGVSGTFSILPAPGVVRTVQTAGEPEDQIHMKIHVENDEEQHPQERAGSVASDVTDVIDQADLLEVAETPARLEEIAAEYSYRVRDYAFSSDWEPVPSIQTAPNGFPEVPPARMANIDSAPELVDIEAYIILYESSLEEKYMKERLGHPAQQYGIPGKILTRLLALGYTSMDEYRRRLCHMDWEALARYNKLCAGRVKAGKRGYTAAGEHPWKVANYHPPQLLPPRARLNRPLDKKDPKDERLRGYLGCLKREWLYYNPPKLYATALNRRAELDRMRERDAQARAEALKRRAQGEDEEEEEHYEGKGKGKAVDKGKGKAPSKRTFEQASDEENDTDTGSEMSTPPRKRQCQELWQQPHMADATPGAGPSNGCNTLAASAYPGPYGSASAGPSNGNWGALSSGGASAQEGSDTDTENEDDEQMPFAGPGSGHGLPTAPPTHPPPPPSIQPPPSTQPPFTRPPRAQLTRSLLSMGRTATFANVLEADNDNESTGPAAPPTQPMGPPPTRAHNPAPSVAPPPPTTRRTRALGGLTRTATFANVLEADNAAPMGPPPPTQTTRGPAPTQPTRAPAHTQASNTARVAPPPTPGRTRTLGGLARTATFANVLEADNEETGSGSVETNAPMPPHAPNAPPTATPIPALPLPTAPVPVQAHARTATDTQVMEADNDDATESEDE
ncbi:hypothetical protein HDZ31DRAFT_63296 [Schizophyllum fasciatum]